ncbi:5-formyltetrahydrofolate cyclo-ligase [Bacillus sp. FJAT-50079]|uniref:5-formyltetrahydrofolate cyclo-ligase n=1 Tax=Bacillus sp. FJAT-50079 TaxID=2833577 RepID=UPI001BC95847|nr:5-formyltetrahydrofolate cyclo-ligase [Bacillus sp. FJAT-50079]MBS4209598.1 5-formyltetrahydrofolate cyclo-ligase [Bacillus sp. FJAT-50079]
MDKKMIRKQMSDYLNEMDEMTYKKKSGQIADRLIDTTEWIKAETIAITISQFPEVETRRLIKEGWAQGKIISVPKCIPASKEMVFKKITSFDQLESAYYGLLEPIEETEAIEKEQLQLIIVPGLIYNRSGYRIGFGGGYYDRYLKRFQGKMISLAFAEQIIDDIPTEAHDIPVHKIITNKEVISC